MRQLGYLTAHLMVLSVTAQYISQNGAQSNIVTIQTCSEGTYRSGDNCKSCTKCNDNEFLANKCNTTHDSVCECMPDFYRDSVDNGQCKECTKCAVGWGASPACTTTTNTVCVVCPRDSYSSVESSTKSCQSCTHCDQRNEFVLNSCTSKQDTTCFRVQPKESTVTEVQFTTVTCPHGECIAQKDNTYLYTAPLYCAVLGAIILGLLIYVMLRCRINKKRAQMAMANNNNYSKPMSSYQIVPQLGHYSSTAPPAPTTSPIVFLESSGKTVAVTVATKYVDLPSNIRRTVSRGLSLDGSWLKLAHYLGFTPSQISQIQQKAEESNQRSSVGAILLSEWSKRDFSSLGVIIHALASINRLDLVALLQNSNSMKGSEIV